MNHRDLIHICLAASFGGCIAMSAIYMDALVKENARISASVRAPVLLTNDDFKSARANKSVRGNFVNRLAEQLPIGEASEMIYDPSLEHVLNFERAAAKEYGFNPDEPDANELIRIPSYLELMGRKLKLPIGISDAFFDGKLIGEDGPAIASLDEAVNIIQHRIRSIAKDSFYGVPFGPIQFDYTFSRKKLQKMGPPVVLRARGTYLQIKAMRAEKDLRPAFFRETERQMAGYCGVLTNALTGNPVEKDIARFTMMDFPEVEISRSGDRYMVDVTRINPLFSEEKKRKQD